MFGLDWRIPAYRRYWFYLRTTRNARQLIRDDRANAPTQEIVLRSGRRMRCVDRWSRLIFREVWFQSPYLAGYHGTPHTVVDIGANAGFFTALVLDRWPHARVYAYEPAPETAALLRENVPDCVVHQKAVSDRVGTMTLHLDSASGGHSLHATQGAEVEVETVDLAAVLAESGPVDFMKIDCEGAEAGILEAGRSLLTSSVRYLVLEYHQQLGVDPAAIQRLLNDCGYAVRSTPPDTYGCGIIAAEKRPDA